MRQTVRSSCVFSLCLIPLLPLFASPAHAGGERQLVEDINDYRAQPQRCAGRTVQALTPLALKSNLALPIGYGGVTRETLKDSGYQAVSVRTIRLVGAEDAEEAFDMLQSRYCGALLDTQFADIGVHRDESEWQVVLARPLLDGHLDDPRAAGKTLLAQVNAARAKPRLCGRQRFAAAPPLTWNAALGTAAQGHSRAMANDNYFAHQDPNGDMPWDRAKAAGYGGRQIGENIAAGQRSPGKAMEGWLASPGHCANLMNPMFTQVGAAYAANSRSDNGVYWTMLFGAK
ncbi:CAP domain-containing protein [Pseudomonas sp. NPDC087697]|uniref:CAP domain-containing protein n=1 Tax=Pseudomonas sp. NPDC087697 TaxID=3364447 RepID=UPI0037F8AB9E